MDSGKITSPNKTIDKRSILVTSIAAVALLVVTGLGYRIFAEYLARPTESVPLPAGTLANLPLSLGEWVGRDVPLDPAIIEATDSDDHVNRIYSRYGQTQVIGLFIAYGVRARDLMPHRPEVCYPGAGWALKETQMVRLDREGKSPLESRMYQFDRGGFDARVIAVLNYYVVDGKYSPDVSMIRSKAWRGSDAVRYMAQVQITCQGTSALSPEAADRAIRAFAVDSADEILGLFPERQEGLSSGKEGEQVDEQF